MDPGEAFQKHESIANFQSSIAEGLEAILQEEDHIEATKANVANAVALTAASRDLRGLRKALRDGERVGLPLQGLAAGHAALAEIETNAIAEACDSLRKACTEGIECFFWDAENSSLETPQEYSLQANVSSSSGKAIASRSDFAPAAAACADCHDGGRAPAAPACDDTFQLLKGMPEFGSMTFASSGSCSSILEHSDTSVCGDSSCSPVGRHAKSGHAAEESKSTTGISPGARMLRLGDAAGRLEAPRRKESEEFILSRTRPCGQDLLRTESGRIPKLATVLNSPGYEAEPAHKPHPLQAQYLIDQKCSEPAAVRNPETVKRMTLPHMQHNNCVAPSSRNDGPEVESELSVRMRMQEEVAQSVSMHLEEDERDAASGYMIGASPELKQKLLQRHSLANPSPQRVRDERMHQHEFPKSRSATAGIATTQDVRNVPTSAIAGAVGEAFVETASESRRPGRWRSGKRNHAPRTDS